jgi:hypothetical protein
MKTFTDNLERPWHVVVNVDTIKRVRSLLDVDLMDVLKGGLIERLTNDPVLLADVLYAVCKPAADASRVTDEEFGKALGGDAITLATNALMEALTDFFPSGKRELIRRTLAKYQEAETLMMASVGANIDKLDVKDLVAKANATIQESLGASSGSAPASSDSTPAR